MVTRNISPMVNRETLFSINREILDFVDVDQNFWVVDKIFFDVGVSLLIEKPVSLLTIGDMFLGCGNFLS